jgi:hypothetical protein
MEKISQLLNENTIVDFKHMFKLCLRYSSHFFIAVAIAVGIFIYNYFQQPIIYAVNVPVKVLTNHTVSTDLTTLVPIENSNVLTLSELKISLENYTFLKNFAAAVIEDPQFPSFNLGSIMANKNVFGQNIKQTCLNSKTCMIEQVSVLLKNLFIVEQGVTDNRFILSVNAIDKKTVLKLTPIIIKAIDQDRVHVRQYLVLKEIQSVGNLITESRSIMHKMEGYAALEEQEKLQNSIDNKKEEIKILQLNLSQELANYKALESRLLANKNSTNSRAISSKDDFDRILKDQQRLKDINQNLTILTAMPEENRSSSDNFFISQLMKEKQKLQKLLPSEHRRKSMELEESFVEGQRTKTSDIEFDFTVSKNKFEKLSSDYNVAKDELNTMIERKINLESKVIGMKSDLEFLKSLESKQMSLKLLSASMNSDLYFEDAGSIANEYRQSSNIKIFLFSFGMTFFLYIFSIFIRFMFDDRIYGEDEIRGHFKTLDFVGEVPKFD